MSVEEKVVVVTGAGGEVGRAVVGQLAGAGARVVAASRSAPRLPSDLKSDVLPLVADIADEASANRLVAETVARCGRLDVLINVVGGWEGGGPVAEMPTEVWRRM